MATVDLTTEYAAIVNGADNDADDVRSALAKILVAINGGLDSNNVNQLAQLITSAAAHGSIPAGTNQHTGASISLTDAGGYFATDQVEFALQQVGARTANISQILICQHETAEITLDATGHTKVDVDFSTDGLADQADANYKIIITAYEMGNTTGGFTPAADEKYVGYDYVNHVVHHIISQKVLTTGFSVRFTDIGNNPFTGKIKFDYMIVR